MEFCKNVQCDCVPQRDYMSENQLNSSKDSLRKPMDYKPIMSYFYMINLTSEDPISYGF